MDEVPPVPQRPKLSRRARMRFDKTRDSHVLLLPERVVMLNESTAAILALCDGERSVADIVAELKRQFEQAPVDEIAADVNDLLREAMARKWLEST